MEMLPCGTISEKSPKNIFWEKLKNVDFDPKMPHLPHFEHK